MRSNVLHGRKSISCANSVLPVFMAGSPRQIFGGTRSRDQIRLSNDRRKTPSYQCLTGKTRSVNRTAVSASIKNAFPQGSVKSPCVPGESISLRDDRRHFERLGLPLPGRALVAVGVAAMVMPSAAYRWDGS